MKIALLTMGTRGDVQPFAILGKALTAKGHAVTLSTSKNFRQLAESNGLFFKPVENDYQELLNSEEGKKLLKANPFVIKRNLNKWIYPLIRHSLQLFYDLAEESDLIIYHSKTMADYFADIMPGKMIRAMVVPAIQATSAFANPAFSGFPVPAFLNKWSYKLNDLSFKILRKPVAEFRQSRGLSVKVEKISTPFLYGISNAFLPKPADYPPDQYFTGFWFSNTKSNLEPALLNFVENGEAPLLITFGSMPYKSRISISELAEKIMEKFGVRIILIKAWGVNANEKLHENRNVFIVDNAPYDALLPKVKAVIHHGGVGTIAECLRAGRPMLIFPVLYPVGDQQFWGKQTVKKGVGVEPLPLSKITIPAILKRIEQLLSDTSLYENAALIAEEIKKENGVENAIKIIEGISSNSV